MRGFLMRVLAAVVVAGWISLPSLAQAVSVPINLNDFFSNPTVTVAPTGVSAAFAEDSALGSVLLSNDPGLSDPNVIIPGPGVLLRFNYSFTEGAGENDEFGAFIIDASTGGSIGAPFEFFTQATGSGSVSFALTSLDGQTLGLQFQLAALIGDAGLTSTLTVEDVRLEIAAVPEPSTWLLLASGLVGLATARLTKQKIRRYALATLVFLHRDW